MLSDDSAAALCSVLLAVELLGKARLSKDSAARTYSDTTLDGFESVYTRYLAQYHRLPPYDSSDRPRATTGSQARMSCRLHYLTDTSCCDTCNGTVSRYIRRMISHGHGCAPKRNITRLDVAGFIQQLTELLHAEATATDQAFVIDMQAQLDEALDHVFEKVAKVADSDGSGSGQGTAELLIRNPVTNVALLDATDAVKQRSDL